MDLKLVTEKNMLRLYRYVKLPICVIRLSAHSQFFHTQKKIL